MDNQQSPWAQARKAAGFGGFGSSSSGSGGNNGGGNSGGGGPTGNASGQPQINFQMPNFKALTKKALIILAIVLVVVILVSYWWFHPPLNIHSSDVWIFGSIFILLPAYLVFNTLSETNKKGTKKKEANPEKAKRFKYLSYIPVLIVAIGIVGAILSSTVFNAKAYSEILVTTDEDFAEDIAPVNYTEIPVIDRASAVILGNRTMGTMADYVSQFEISELYSQINYQGKPVRVSPLGYADIIKWFTNREQGIPAYVLVDMTTQDTEIVRLTAPIKYSQSEPLARNIDRYIQLKYPFYMFEEFSFEIDEDGNPWWVCPVQTRTIGLFGGETIDRVILCNASTGECQDIPLEECPEWVDRVFPAELLIEQYNWSGAYLNGWINSWLGQSGVKQTTPGTDDQLGYNYIAKDDDVWVYTGVTSATADNSIIGFVLVNQRTSESHFYAIAGATEESAMGSAEGQVQNLAYTSTFPLLLNISDQPTYFMALKDNAGLVKKYAMIDIQRYQNVAVGDTVSDCQIAYEKLLLTNGVLDEIDEPLIQGETASGTIQKIAQVVIDGNSHFFVTISGDDRIFDCALPNIIDVLLYEVGDTVELSFVVGDPTCSVTAIKEA